MVAFSKPVVAEPVLCNSIILNDVLDQILPYLCAADICRLAKVNKALRRTMPRAINHTFSIYRRLKHFFNDPFSFRVMQSRTGALVSGSFALQFFCRVFYPEADLDIYAANDAKRDVGDWLLTNAYTFCPAERPNGQPLTYLEALQALDDNRAEETSYVQGVVGVLNFLRTVEGEVRKVQLVVVDGCPMTAILNFHSTCVMNVITYNYAYCLYPKATLRASSSLLLKSSTEALWKAVRKYRSRGFEFKRLAGADNQYYDDGQVRCLLDAHTWAIPLPRINFDMEAVDRMDPVSLTTWSIATFPHDFHRVHYRVEDDEPGVFPLIVATNRLKDDFARVCLRQESLGLFDGNERTLTGNDMDTQRVVKELEGWMWRAYWNKHDGYFHPY